MIFIINLNLKMNNIYIYNDYYYYYYYYLFIINNYSLLIIIDYFNLL